MVALMKIVTAMAFGATSLAAPGTTSLAAPGTTSLAEAIPTELTDPRFPVNSTLAPIGGYTLDSCEISCHPWYRFCERRPYNYKCQDDGHFKWGRYHGGCSAQCFCRCDSQ